MDLFHWTTVNVSGLLPADWQAQVLRVSKEEFVAHTLVSNHSTSREATHDEELLCGGVGGRELGARLPWLRDLYYGRFLQLAQAFSREAVSAMSDDRFAIVLNVQRADERYECHIDSNPIAGLLYCTNHADRDGGQLVVSNRGDVRSVEEIDRDCTVIEPKAGHLVLFDGRRHSHYVRSLTDSTKVRVVAAMNYYTTSCPEGAVRPADLNKHLTGQN